VIAYLLRMFQFKKYYEATDECSRSTVSKSDVVLLCTSLSKCRFNRLKTVHFDAVLSSRRRGVRIFSLFSNL
jgi:hypothetical protein